MFEYVGEQGFCSLGYLYLWDNTLPHRAGVVGLTDAEKLVNYPCCEGKLGANTRHVVRIADRLWMIVCYGKFDAHAAVSLLFVPAPGSNPEGKYIGMLGLPLDGDYFVMLEYLYNHYGMVVVEHVAAIVNKMPPFKGQPVDDNMYVFIRQLASYYHGYDFTTAFTAFLHMYAGFVAEENKNNTRVGCLIKFRAFLDFTVGDSEMGRKSVQEAIDDAYMNWQEIRDKAAAYGAVRPWVNYYRCACPDKIEELTGYRVGPGGLLIPKN